MGFFFHLGFFLFICIKEGVPQDFIPGPLLFSINDENLCNKWSNAEYHFYVNDTVIYCSPCVIQTLEVLQSLMLFSPLVLSAEKSKFIMELKKKTSIQSSQDFNCSLNLKLSFPIWLSINLSSILSWTLYYSALHFVTGSNLTHLCTLYANAKKCRSLSVHRLGMFLG